MRLSCCFKLFGFITALNASAALAGQGDPLPVVWHHGVPSCDEGNSDEPIQTFFYDADTVILRQNICLSPEAPFMYLLFGSDKALLLDTGDVPDEAAFPLRETVTKLLQEHAVAHHSKPLRLVVAHTHSHGDHVSGDAQFAHQPDTSLVGYGKAVLRFFSLPGWTSAAVAYDLGGRSLEVLPIPGHFTDHIALYDQKTALLLTGDTLYPGRLYIQEGHWASYQASVARLWAFAKDKPVAHVLGAHIEMTTTPGVDFYYSTTTRPNEHVLELTLADLGELNAALQQQAKPTCERRAHFIIWSFDRSLDCEAALH